MKTNPTSQPDLALSDALQDPLPKAGPTGYQGKKGYRKIQNCCKLASDAGFEHVWIDTCCINKSSADELSETLASMFHYYRNAQVCYTYLADVPGSDEPHSEGSRFRKSRWFTRGWTLQELLAPLHVIFFDEDWGEIGTKTSLLTVIMEITGIPSQVLMMMIDVRKIAVQEVFDWARTRETTVPEDKVYCMMDLLGVRMPVVYCDVQGQPSLSKEREKVVFERLEAELNKLDKDKASDFDISTSARRESEYQFFISTQQRLYRPTRRQHLERAWSKVMGYKRRRSRTAL